MSLNYGYPDDIETENYKISMMLWKCKATFRPKIEDPDDEAPGMVWFDPKLEPDDSSTFTLCSVDKFHVLPNEVADALHKAGMIVPSKFY